MRPGSSIISMSIFHLSVIIITIISKAVTLKQQCCRSGSQLKTMVSHARSAAQRREQRRRAEARFAGRLCKLVRQLHRGFVPARALVRAAAGCPQDASTQTLEGLVDAEKEQLVDPTPEGVQLAAVVSALKQQCALTAEFCKSAEAHIDDALSRVKSLEQVVGPKLEGVNLAEAVSALKQQGALTAEISRSTAHEADALIDQHKAMLSRVECLDQLVASLTPEGGDLAAVVSALKQQSALTADISRSAAHEAVHVHLDQHSAVLSRVETLETVVSALKQQCASTAEICRSAAHEAVHALVQPVLSRVETLEHFVGPPSPERLNLASAVPELRQASALIAEISKSDAHEDLSKAELSRVERLEQLAVPPMPVDVKRLASAAAEAVKAYFDDLRSGTGAVAEEEAAQACLVAARVEVETASTKCWRPRQLWRISLAKKKATHKHKKR